MRTAEDVLGRLRLIYGVKTDTELAEALGKKKNTLSTWKSRNSKPFEICEQVALERGISIDWLLTGEGEMYRSGVTAQTPASVLPSGLAGMERRVGSLLGVLAQLTPEDQEAVLSECFTRATTAQQLAELKQTVQDLEATKLSKAG